MDPMPRSLKSVTPLLSTSHPDTARLIVRRVKVARFPDALFPVWRYHPFFTNCTLPTTTADVTYRAHAVIETVFSDLIDGPLAYMPSGLFGANSAWVQCAAIAHNLLRAAGTIAGGQLRNALGATCGGRSSTSPLASSDLNAHPHCTCLGAVPG